MKGFQPLLLNDCVRGKEQADASKEVGHIGDGNGASEGMSHVSLAGG